MRNLTIKRRKVGVGCLGKVKIYIEDPLSHEINIDKTACRKLGELKNGEEQTFQIGDEAAKIYVIADKLTKEYANEFYQLPEGSDDLVLTGQMQMSVGNNMFRFDENNSEGIQTKRKKGKIIGVIVTVAALILGFAVGKLFFGWLVKSGNEAKEFTSHGMTITLTEDFKEDSVMGFTSVFRSKDVMLLNLREPFTMMDGAEELTLSEYGRLVVENNGLSVSDLKDFGGIPGFEYDYTDPDSGDTYHYRTFLYKADDAFWMAQFATYKDMFSKYENQIGEWAKSVTFGA